MKRALKIIGIVLAVLAVVFVGGAYLLPKEVNVERDIVIDAPPDVVFGHVNSFETFNEWSPWAERDPETEYTYPGPDSGVGAKMEWKSDHSEVGSGSQEIIASEPNELVRTKLHFEGQGTSEAYFELESVDVGTRLTWGMDADMGNNPIGRWMGLMMDGWIGTDYEKGLASLKEMIESEGESDTATAGTKQGDSK